jgi:hypothetical protein
VLGAPVAPAVGVPIGNIGPSIEAARLMRIDRPQIDMAAAHVVTP